MLVLAACFAAFMNERRCVDDAMQRRRASGTQRRGRRSRRRARSSGTAGRPAATGTWSRAPAPPTRVCRTPAPAGASPSRSSTSARRGAAAPSTSRRRPSPSSPTPTPARYKSNIPSTYVRRRAYICWHAEHLRLLHFFSMFITYYFLSSKLHYKTF